MTAGENPFQSPADIPNPLGEEEPLVAEGILTAADLHAAYRLLTFNPNMLAILLTGCVIGALLLGTIHPELFRMEWVAFHTITIAALTLGTLSSLYFVFPYWRRMRRQLLASPERQRLTLTAAGIRLESAGTVVNIPWSQIQRVRASRRVLFLQTSTGRMIFAPAHFFESETDYRVARRKIADGMRFAASAPAWTPLEVDAAAPVGDDAIVAEGENSWRDLLLCYWHLLWLPILLLLPIISLLAAGGFCLLVLTLFLLEPHPALPALILLHLAIPALLLWLAAVYYRTIRRQYQSQVAGIHRKWTITKESLEETTPHEKTEYRWSDVTKLVEYDDRLLMIQNRRDAHCLPRRFFASDDDWRQVLAWAREKRG
ncbi:YcxB family protein [Blastopirellula sp. JC732]|uniref:YcxB family protein n=1 Tax=Blastopirellula sediminis TaxID=2894196 RepID=A0A9X1MLR7_9BACT|nr:YcxB family protein [Blastopirellula sediminis]MCC9607541.1 YcxB family protein [Blastopirellula sediminis]MCC9629166.1 YcxB family protein [Blastopirellula sediminis]